MDASRRETHAASFSRSSSTKRWTYQVFLSFRGDDTRKGFTGHLRQALSNDGITAFIDDNELRSGESIQEQLKQAIQGSMVSIIVFSKRYADSSWCLDELATIMDCHEKLGHMVFPLLYDVDPTDVRKQTGCFAPAFQKHDSGVLEGRLTEERVRQWRKALTDAANLPGDVLQNTDNGHEANFIRTIIGKINKQWKSEQPLDIEYSVGIDSRVKHLSDKLDIGSSKDVRMVGILGMGGIGKTTLAKAIYNQLGARFEGRSFLANVREIVASQPINGLVGLQEQLLRDILKSKEIIKIGSVDQGISEINKRLACKKALVIIDDVDEVDQLKSIARSRDWFGPGSRIIITTRYERLLEQLEVDYTYPAEVLHEKEALELFSWHAFKSGDPNVGYHELSSSIVSYCRGLPLALKVLGSFLFGRGIQEWKSELDKLKEIPPEEVLKKLRISYDGLGGHRQKAIFLDISCFFIGTDKDYVTKILDGCNFNAEIGINELQKRCLVTVDEDNMLGMHDLLRDMGREIVSAESHDDPERRSRLWKHEEVTDVLRFACGTNEIQGLSLNLQISNKASFSAQAFQNMRKLRLLQLNYVELTGGYGYLSTRKLSWLCWYGFPLPSIPNNFDLEILVVMDLQYSKLIQVWEHSKLLGKLKIINLSHSPDLTKTPDLSEVPNLEELILEDCQSLSEVHSSRGDLERLTLVNLKDCKMLKDLPLNLYNSKSLKTLILDGCSSFGNLAEGIGNIVSLTTLVAENTAIRQIPSSIVKLKNLQILSLNGVRGSPSTNLLPPSLHGLSSLIFLDISNCDLTDDSIPEDLGSLLSLESLNLDRNNFRRIQSLRGLSMLEDLSVNFCINLQAIPDLPRNLKVLRAVGCTAIETMPDFSEMPNMRELFLSDSPKLTDIPGLDKSLNSMTMIRMEGCTSLTTDFRKKILQGWTSCGFGGIFLNGNYIPDWFDFVNGDLLKYDVPQSVGRDLTGLTLCCVYSVNSKPEGLIRIKVANKRTRTTLYARITYASVRSLWEREDNYVWQGQLSNDVLKLQGGDDVHIYVGAPFDDLVKVKKMGVNVVWDKHIKENMQDFDVYFWQLNADDEAGPSHDASDLSRDFNSKDDDDEDKEKRKEMDLDQFPALEEVIQGDNIVGEPVVLVRPSFELFDKTISVIPNEQNQENTDVSLPQVSLGFASTLLEQEIQPQEGHRTDDQAYKHIGTQDKVVNPDAAANDDDESTQPIVQMMMSQEVAGQNRIGSMMTTTKLLGEKGTSLMTSSPPSSVRKRKRWDSTSEYQEALKEYVDEATVLTQARAQEKDKESKVISLVAEVEDLKAKLKAKTEELSKAQGEHISRGGTRNSM